MHPLSNEVRMSSRAALIALLALLALVVVPQVLTESAVWAQSSESEAPVGAESPDSGSEHLAEAESESAVEKTAAAPATSPQTSGFIERIDRVFGVLVSWLSFVL